MKLPTARAMPDAFVILFFIVLAAAISSYLFPAGWFAMVDIVDSAGNITQRIDPQQFFMTYDNAHHVSLFSANDKTGLTNFAFDGMTSGDRMGSAVGVMAFILIVGGAFGVVMDTGAITHCIMAMIAKLQRSQVLLIPLLFIIFSLSGAIYGMSEEAIAFCIVLLPLFQALGYSAATVVMVTYLSTQIGFATSWMNPFSVAIAQGIAGVPLMSGAGLRIAAWFVFTVVGLIFTLRYAKKHRSAVDATLVHANDNPLNNKCSSFDILVLLCLLGVIMWVIWGVVSQGYYIPQIASQFFALALVVGLIAVLWRKRSLNQISSAFQKGASELLPAAMIVGFAKGVVLLLGGDDPQQPSILNTALHYAGESLATLPDVTSAIVMYIFQSIMNFFVASGSGQAALTMPIMAPLSDIAGVTRQVSVLCFQFGDGLTNLVIPTSASLMGCLGVAKISYAQWLALIWRFQLLLTLMASAVILFAVITGYS
ncbi:putative basic amino acid antiporter YfcC [Shewanella baltica]|uniref:putative basic amino acid antiporter YfcC n=1 Tax=Shewanella baltica TaxID=62322 RepID=UPI00217D63AE|nr:putative basic amino acid antiporter YfcC [Shewanella baltica]MCS6100579.1 putative basic amino acid antiporter YfcC [Shewanella baltica]MCS6185449.1 putative basic amino acid antiporter YfcC [Shewanella baltica]